MHSALLQRHAKCERHAGQIACALVDQAQRGGLRLPRHRLRSASRELQSFAGHFAAGILGGDFSSVVGVRMQIRYDQMMQPGCRAALDTECAPSATDTFTSTEATREVRKFR